MNVDPILESGFLELFFDSLLQREWLVQIRESKNQIFC